jgi:predicted nucleic acid-binding protein
VLYIDSNVFVYAALNTEKLGDRARSLLSKIQRGKEQAVTSALAFDELVWVVKKHRSMEDAVSAGEALLNFPNLKLVVINGDLLVSALNLIKKYNLDPRDAIHAATALMEKAKTFVSTDSHFDRITELKRKPL